MLEHTDERLISELERQTGCHADTLHTGGGVMVARVLLDEEQTRQVWLTREDTNTWLVGFYNYDLSDNDEGVCLELRGFRRHGPQRLNPSAIEPESTADDPEWVAERVAGILQRLGVIPYPREYMWVRYDVTGLSPEARDHLAGEAIVQGEENGYHPGVEAEVVEVHS